jgi:methylmalonyl-CoA/ethylmalonyl-CoA epimerase
MHSTSSNINLVFAAKSGWHRISYTVTLDNADGAAIAGLAAGESLVELLEAQTDDSPIAKFVAKRGPGIHHVCFAVDDLDGTLDKCRAAGLRLIDETPRIGAEGKRIAFLHPSATGGVLVELSEY